MKQEMLEVKDIKKYFKLKGMGKKTERLKAVDGISFPIARGEALGLVGRSSYGKSTAGRIIIRLAL